MEERIRAHVVSVWRESKSFLSIGGKEGMLILTDDHLSFVHKTRAKMRWWQAIVQRQVMIILRTKNIMNIHDGYDENNLREDLENENNVELAFDDILDINWEEKSWGSVLNLEYEKENKHEKFQFAVARDWVKYPMKEPTKYMKVDWKPFVQYIKDRQKFVR